MLLGLHAKSLVVREVEAEREVPESAGEISAVARGVGLRARSLGPRTRALARLRTTLLGVRARWFREVVVTSFGGEETRNYRLW